MKKAEMEEKPLVNVERNLFFVAGLVLASSLLCYAGISLLGDMQPLGFLVLIPAAILSFQTLWYILTPFAVIFESRAEIKQSWFHYKERYFNDLNRVSQDKSGRLFITYTDGEVEKISLFGIKPSHRELLKENFRKQIARHSAARV